MNRNAKKMVARFLTTMLVIMLAAPAMADLAPGGHGGKPTRPYRPAKPDAVPIMIRVDPQAEQSVLRIPKGLLPAEKLGALDEQQPGGAGSIRHVIAAIALSCAITGLFFVRRDRKARTAVVVVVCVCALAAAGSLMANAPAPAPRPEPTPPAEVPNQTNVPAQLLNGVNGDVRIELTDGGTVVTLIVSGKLAKSSGLTTATDASAPAAVSAPALSRAPNAPAPQ